MEVTYITSKYNIDVDNAIAILKVNKKICNRILTKYGPLCRENLIAKYNIFSEKYDFTELEKCVGHDYINSFNDEEYEKYNQSHTTSCSLDGLGALPSDPHAIIIGTVGVGLFYLCDWAYSKYKTHNKQKYSTIEEELHLL